MPSAKDFTGSLPPLADVWRRSFVELMGAFALVFVGAGTIMSIGPQADAGEGCVHPGKVRRDTGRGQVGWALATRGTDVSRVSYTPRHRAGSSRESGC